jgi:hypothetical protein
VEGGFHATELAGCAAFRGTLQHREPEAGGAVGCANCEWISRTAGWNPGRTGMQGRRYTGWTSFLDCRTGGVPITHSPPPPPTQPNPTRSALPFRSAGLQQVPLLVHARARGGLPKQQPKTKPAHGDVVYLLHSVAA